MPHSGPDNASPMAAVCHRELRHYDFGELVDRIDHHAIIADGVDGAGTDRKPRC